MLAPEAVGRGKTEILLWHIASWCCCCPWVF
jgi:hypothetical protein